MGRRAGHGYSVSAWAVDPTTTAFIGLGVLLLTGVLDWEDVLKEKSAWDTIVWFSALVMMATFLNKLGLIALVLVVHRKRHRQPGPGWAGAAVRCCCWPTCTRTTCSPAPRRTSRPCSAPSTAPGSRSARRRCLFALLMAAASNIMMTLTHYATGTSPVIFGSGYTTLGEWWTAGFVMSLVLIVVWLVAGGVWWKLLGYW